MLCSPLVFRVHRPSVHQDKGAEVTTEILVRLANMMETALQWTDFNESAQLSSRVSEIYRIGSLGQVSVSIKGQAPSTSLSCSACSRGAFQQESLLRTKLKVNQASCLETVSRQGQSSRSRGILQIRAGCWKFPQGASLHVSEFWKKSARS